MSAPVITGILSYGMSGRIFHAPFISAHVGFALRAITERNKKTAAADYPDIISYNSVEELLADKQIELVIVNTPGYTHFDLARQALRAGKHVLVEKPAVATVAQLRELYDLARVNNLHLMVYQNRRWDSDFLAVKQVIESGRLGRLIEVHFRFDRYKPMLSPKKFKEDASLPPNGLVYDLGPHLIDQAISLFGRPLSFHKTVGSYRQNSEVPDYFNFHFVFPHQLNVYLTSGLLIAQPVPSYIIHGTLGSFIKDRTDVQEEQLDKGMKPTNPNYGIETAGKEGLLTIPDLDGNNCTEQIVSGKGNYMHLFDAVYHTIRNGALYPITEEHIAWQIELLEADIQ